MIVKTHILNTLNDLDRRFNTSPSNFEATYYSKLAVIEGCGWIELSMDHIVESYFNRKIRTSQFKKVCKTFVKKNYGFQYEDNFKKMLLPTIGVKQVEKLEVKLNKRGLIDILIAELEALKIHRNDASHTYIRATTRYPSPSSVKGQVETIYPILKQIHSEIRSL